MPCRRCGRLTATAKGKLDEASSQPLPVFAAQDDVEERRWVRALILAYLASLNRSLFAAKCLVEVVVEMYREGVTLDDAKVMLSLASLQHGGQLLKPMDEDILLSWVAVIMIALQAVGVPLNPEGEERMKQQGRQNPADDEGGMIAGLRGMVRVSVDQFLAGTDLFRLQLQQSMAAKMEGDGGGPSPGVFMLQQNTRLAIIALEVVRGMGLPTVVSLRQAPSPSSPLQEGEEPAESQPAAQSSSIEQQQQQQQQQQHVPCQHWVPGFVLACDSAAMSRCTEAEQQRASAVRLLISFMGASQGWLYPAWDFVSQCMECYERGWAAEDVYDHLQDEEFAQSGGLVINVARVPGSFNVTAAMFGRWLSVVYMTMVQLGVVFAGATRQDGWAWVSGAAQMHADEEAGSTLEAYGLADFVLHTLNNEEQKEKAGRPGSSGAAGGEEAEQAVVEGVLARETPEQLRKQARMGFVTLEDPELLPTSPSVLIMSQQISLVQMARQLVLQERTLAPSSTA
ncbi:expressed protein [Chlorella variabilis]|uniref:Expressed protein n=1 Tax=Chlorella variabilis TaxID=554065 RepID=E1ZFS7_CHLVA|nr:expressed protein [Chlorella variabilis]EFN55333.1 expressed protein [Chlorella variabilis]|eukprot:XP_005847435.1 expressed protein [Chlorella variabilis]